ncbi:hypothetical protein ACOSQ3_001484 [Xanthoceras sorbifolium]
MLELEKEDHGFLLAVAEVNEIENRYSSHTRAYGPAAGLLLNQIKKAFYETDHIEGHRNRAVTNAILKTQIG